MCGIVALWKCDEPGILTPMLDVIAHRGPDDQGAFHHEGSAIGVRRLSILDVEGGHQPAFNQNGTIAVALNGEIYNHVELRGELQALGHRFKSACDTEVLAHGLERWGITGLLEKCRGMFALAAIDTGTGRMHVARDRLGIKPLYWAETGNGLAFVSEIKSLFMHPGLSPAVDETKIPEQLANRFVAGAETIFSGVHRLPPGTHWTMESGAEPERRRYWQIPDPGSSRPTFEEVSHATQQLVRDAVRDRLVSDVPVGALLSGGLDSSVVVSQMDALADRSPMTFTVGFGDRDLDERPHARTVARHFGTKHTEEEVLLDNTDSLSEVMWHFDEPVGDAAALPTLLIARTAARHVKVVLTGEGSDELFGGYPRYNLSVLADRFYRFPSTIWKPLLAPLQLLPGTTGHVARRLVSSEGDIQLRNALWMSNLAPKHLRALCPQAATSNWQDAYGSGQPGQPWRIDMTRWLLDDILLKVDKMSMGASLEARVPFLDHRLVEYISRIPDDLRSRWLGKTVLRQAFKSVLPATVFERRKAPFKPPVTSWMRNDTGKHLEAMVSEVGSFAKEFLDSNAARKLLKEHRNGADHGLVLWQLYTLETWWRRFFKETSWH